eukprot:CAMPEP_0185835136 /NCGR_PEP_ID=MMETSP1353-20130828/7131_1 /TAXON_ID=1077150 /ORGANISM="Erythrolobus australicus, Strain CCMP3124" /LENGTH=135 /DNA_ID=CAMNT_0028533715 /DNA_START=448 /DNA_END=855 /DNA_ORIENTATION=+
MALHFFCPQHRAPLGVIFPSVARHGECKLDEMLSQFATVHVHAQHSTLQAGCGQVAAHSNLYGVFLHKRGLPFSPGVLIHDRRRLVAQRQNSVNMCMSCEVNSVSLPAAVPHLANVYLPARRFFSPTASVAAALP